MLSYSDLWFTVNHNTTIPASNCHLFSEITISQGSVVTHLRYGGICIYHFTANLSPSLTVKEFWKSVKIWQSYRCELGGPVYLEHSVYKFTTDIDIMALLLFFVLTNSFKTVCFLQRAQCSHCKRCISYGNSVRPSVHLSHAGIVSKRPLDSKMCLVL